MVGLQDPGLRESPVRASLSSHQPAQTSDVRPAVYKIRLDQDAYAAIEDASPVV